MLRLLWPLSTLEHFILTRASEHTFANSAEERGRGGLARLKRVVRGSFLLHGEHATMSKSSPAKF